MKIALRRQRRCPGSRILSLLLHAAGCLLIGLATAASAESRFEFEISGDQALSQAGTAPHLHPVDLIALDEALERLERVDPEKHRVVELRYFMDLTEKEIARVQGVSVNTVQRRWQAARLWLLHELSGRGAAAGT